MTVDSLKETPLQSLTTNCSADQCFDEKFPVLFVSCVFPRTCLGPHMHTTYHGMTAICIFVNSVRPGWSDI